MEPIFDLFLLFTEIELLSSKINYFFYYITYCNSISSAHVDIMVLVMVG